MAFSFHNANKSCAFRFAFIAFRSRRFFFTDTGKRGGFSFKLLLICASAKSTSVLIFFMRFSLFIVVFCRHSRVSANGDPVWENVVLVVLGQLLEQRVDAVNQTFVKCLHFFHAFSLPKVFNVLSKF